MGNLKPRVLLVDDEPGIVKVVARRLEAEGYAVTTAGDGDQALREAASARPDLLILDVMLPKVNGFEVCRRLKEDAQTRGIPILMLTAMSQARDRKAGFDCGADAYLCKPFRSNDFMEKVKALLSNPNGSVKERGTP